VNVEYKKERKEWTRVGIEGWWWEQPLVVLLVKVKGVAG
jgi:hypothetical protein